MGTIEQKLNKIIQTKQRLKNNINSLGGGLTESSKFSDYPLALSQLYSRLPKTSYQTGTNINLGKTLKAVVQYEDDKVMYGDTIQDSTTGNQLLNIENYDTNYSVYVKEVTNSYMILESRPNISYEQVMYWQDVSLESGTTYYITRNIDVISGTLQSTEGYVELYQGTTWKKILLQNTNSGTFTVDETGTYRIRVRIRIANQSETIKFKIYNFMISKTQGTWEKYTGGIPSPNPSYPENISVVTGTQEVVVRGKNLFNGTLYNGQIGSNGAFSSSTTRITNVTSETASSGSTDFLRKGTYTLSIDNLQNCTLLTKNSSGTILENFANSWQTLPFTFTLTQDGYVYFTARKSDNSTLTPSDYKVQIESGSTATTYEPYITPTTYTLHLGNMEFAGIGDYVDDIEFNLDEGKWYKKVNISKKILNTSNVTIFAYNDTKKYVNISKTTLNIPKGATTGTTLCSHFREVTNATDFEVGTYRNNGNVDNLWVKTPDSVTNLDEAKAYLNSYNAIFYGTIRTATDEEITDTTLISDLDNIYAMMSIEGTTIIEVSGNLPGSLKVRAIKGE